MVTKNSKSKIELFERFQNDVYIKMCQKELHNIYSLSMPKIILDLEKQEIIYKYDSITESLINKIKTDLKSYIETNYFKEFKNG